MNSIQKVIKEYVYNKQKRFVDILTNYEYSTKFEYAKLHLGIILGKYKSINNSEFKNSLIVNELLIFYTCFFFLSI